MFLRPFGLDCNACFGILFVSILCTCCSHFFWCCFIFFTMSCAPIFPLIHWFFSLSNFVIPSKCLKNFICAASKRCSTLLFSTQASLPNFNAALAVMLWILNFVFLFISFPKCLRIAPFILLCVCNLSSKSLLYSDIRYPKYLKSVICSIIFYFLFLKNSCGTQKMCSDFLYTFCWKISHSKKKWSGYDRKSTKVFTSSTRYSCQILTKFKFSRQIFEKYSNIKCHKNPFSGSRVASCGQADRHDEANSRLSQSCERAQSWHSYTVHCTQNFSPYVTEKTPCPLKRQIS